MINLAENLSEDGTIGIRLVQDDFCRQLIKRLRKPLVSTSANVSGAPAPRFYEEITEELKAGSIILFNTGRMIEPYNSLLQS